MDRNLGKGTCSFFHAGHDQNKINLNWFPFLNIPTPLYHSREFDLGLTRIWLSLSSSLNLRNPYNRLNLGNLPSFDAEFALIWIESLLFSKNTF